MKKFLTFLAAAALSSTAWAQDFSYVATPAEGVVPALDEVIVTFSEYDDVDINSVSDITVTLDGEAYDKVHIEEAPFDGNYISISFTPAATSPGTYEIKFAPGSITVWTVDYDDYDNEEEITLTYTIGGASTNGNFKFEAEPTEGSTVTALDAVRVTFTEFAELDLNSKDDITVMLDGKPYTGEVKKNQSGNTISLLFRPAAIDPGTYTINFAPGCIGGYDENYNGPFDLEEDITLTYIIEGAPQGEGSFDYTADPAVGNVKELSTVTLTFPSFEEVEITSKEDIKILYNGEEVAFKASVPSSENKIAFTFDPVLTGEGNVELCFAKGSIRGYYGANEWGYYDNYKDLDEDLTIVYTLVAPTPAVVYDLTFTSGKPQFKTETNKGIVDNDSYQLDMFVINTPEPGIKAADGAMVTLRSADGSYAEEAVIKLNYNTATQSSFKIVFKTLPKFDGVYYLTVPKGCIGNEAWIADNETGRSNDEITLEYTLVNFGTPAGPAYDLVPAEVSPAVDTTVGSLATIELTFDERVYEVTKDDIILSNTENRFSATASVKVSGKVVTLTFDEAPTEYGDYSLIIPKGRFCNNTYAEDPDTGSLNNDLFYTWTLNVNVGVNGINAAEVEAPVYNLTGVKVADTLKELPAGLYIQNGKKVIVK